MSTKLYDRFMLARNPDKKKRQDIQLSVVETILCDAVERMMDTDRLSKNFLDDSNAANEEMKKIKEGIESHL